MISLETASHRESSVEFVLLELFHFSRRYEGDMR